MQKTREQLIAMAFAAMSIAPLAAVQKPAAPDPPARPELVRAPYNAADVEFMSGMIPHHAQAVVIAGWAASHGARPDVRALCERIVVAQRDEIDMMRNWLRDRGEDGAGGRRHAPSHEDERHGARHADAGMLSARGDGGARQGAGPEWDRLFLQGMIRHHEGALKMVDDIFEAYGALQDDDLFKFVSDVYADQTAEIDRMRKCS